jgi:hypothetical protein
MSRNPLHRHRRPDTAPAADDPVAVGTRDPAADRLEGARDADPQATRAFPPVRDGVDGPVASDPEASPDTRVVADRPPAVGHDPVSPADVDQRSDTDPDLHAVPVIDRASVLARQKEAFGGVQLGCAFFGWLTATGTAVLLTAVIAAAGTAIGVASGARSPLSVPTAPATGVRADIAIIVVMLVGYYCGGYVAGRMARFNGVRQGVAVWIWGVVMGLVIAALGAVAGSRFDLLATLNGFPRLQVDQQAFGHAVITVLLAIAAALIGAMLGGLAGMRFHRRVDRAGLDV